jgi:NAD(P)H-dependent FMN reductase
MAGTFKSSLGRRHESPADRRGRGSTRPGRNGKGVADWVLAQAQGRAGVSYELVDRADYPLPHLNEPLPPALGKYGHDHTKRWAAKVAGYDGFVFVTPEYNHSTSGVLKNAIDFLNAEWNNKAAALVGYGGVGGVGGARAVEHLRAVLSEVQVAHVRQALAFSFFTDFEHFSDFAPGTHHAEYATVMFDQLEAWAAALKPLRDGEQAAA